MYILPEEIKRRLHRRYRKRSRDVVVDNRFRGWAWENTPIDPPYDYLLPLSEIANRYCESMRDIYLHYVEKKRKPLTTKMIEGSLYHALVAICIENAKRILYSAGIVDGIEFGIQLNQLKMPIIEDLLSKAKKPSLDDRRGYWNQKKVHENLVWLWDYETNQIAASIDRVRTSQPYIGLDALVNSAIPVIVEQKLDGRNLGLSGHLSADAFGAEGVVLDIKTGTKRYFHRIATTGYAMVIESIYEYPVDIGCIVYCWLRGELPPPINYDIHTIDEPLRQEFLELRDEAMKLIFDQKDPGLPSKCYEDCPFWNECH